MIKHNSFQDNFFLTGVIILSSILIIGLFPGRFDAGLVDENFFITTVTIIPVIAAIYFIITSFRRRLNIKNRDIRESLNKKLTLSFAFIAVLSTMPIVIVSSTYFNQNLSRMFKGSTAESISESLKLTDELYREFSLELKNEIKSIEYFITKYRKNFQHPTKVDIGNTITRKGFNLFIYDLRDSSLILKKTLEGNDYHEDIFKFYRAFKIKHIKTDRLVVRNKELISGALRLKNKLYILTKEIPLELKRREALFYKAGDEYREVENFRDFFVKGSDTFLLILSIAIIGVAYIISLYLSESITRPLIDLSLASAEISKGNYNTEVIRKSDDEIGQLVSSFNQMSRELNSNKKMMFQKQKIEAWNDMAKKLVHEIKNPLTPIRLSAERIRRLVQNKNPQSENAIIEGSETIISEVDSLLKLVREFNNFARLPDKHAELGNLFKLVQETIKLFDVYENVKLTLECHEPDLEILLDRVLLKQAFNNILNNAILVMNEKGNIHIKIEKSIDDFICISVKDDGPGIKKEDIDKIFEPGYTLNKNGTGLGLAIVRKIIIELNGKISCESNLGDGATFTILLPLNLEIKNG